MIFCLLNKYFLKAFIGPCVETVGLIFSRMHVVNSQGKPPKSLDKMDGEESEKWIEFIQKMSVIECGMAQISSFFSNEP